MQVFQNTHYFFSGVWDFHFSKLWLEVKCRHRVSNTNFINVNMKNKINLGGENNLILVEWPE